MKIVDYYTQKTVKMSFLSLLSFPRKRESRGKNWIPFQARNDRREYLYSNRNGVTLIELVIGMVLMGIVALVVANALSTGIKGSLTTDNSKEALDQARVAMERMTREIRNVRSSNDISAATAITFTFVDTEGTLISFVLSGGNINRISGAPNILATSISNNPPLSGIFKYVLTTGIETEDASASLTSIKRIKIDFKATASTESVSLQSEVWPRNL